MKLQRILTIGLLVLSTLQLRAQTPTVTTDMRYARGATMVFGRIKAASANGGSSIQKRGLCIAEHDNPTTADIVSTKTMSHEGIIYYFEGLKPATMYYMRAYATNKDGVTAYGEVVKLATLPMGSITYSYNNGGNTDQNKRINAALTQACDIFSNLTSIKKHFNTGFGAGTPTADCNYQDTPWMNIGPNPSYQRTGTIMHEMQHGLGVIPYSTHWNQNILREGLDGSGRGTGHWLGDRVSEFLDFWDNTTRSRLNGDYQHMWPYGINGANEDDGTLALYYANAMIGQALGEDGLQHTFGTFADPCYVLLQDDAEKYYLMNESSDRGLGTAYLIPQSTGLLRWVTMTADEALQNDSVAWTITFTPNNQYYQFRNVATGQYLTYSSSIRTAKKAKLTANEDWHLMKGRVNVKGTRGYWIIHPTVGWSPECMQANANGRVAAATFDISNDAKAQRWLIRSSADVRAEAPTAIRSIADVQQPAAGRQTVYDLQGRRVTKPTRGLYIVDGRKVLVK